MTTQMKTSEKQSQSSFGENEGSLLKIIHLKDFLTETLHFHEYETDYDFAKGDVKSYDFQMT